MELIQSTKTLLFDLIDLSKKDIYKQSYIIIRIKEIHSNLDKLNTLDSTYRIEQDRKVSDFGASMRQEDSSFDGFMKAMKAEDEWNNLHFAIIEAGNVPDDAFLKKGEALANATSRYMAELEQPSTVTQIVRKSLDDLMLVHYSDERKRWIKRHQIIFFLPKWFRKSIYFLISSLATIMVEKLLPLLIEGLPDYYVSILAGLIIFITLDKYFENLFERYFWRSITPHIVALLKQFNEYLNHVQIFLKNKWK